MSAAQAKKPTLPTKPPTAKQRKILAIKAEHPDLGVRDIATLADVSHPHVIATLQRYGVDQGQVEAYKSHRGDILAGLQHRLLVSVTDEDIKKAPLGSRILAAAQLYDKERLERGQATAIQDYRGLSVQLSGSIEDARRALAMISDEGQVEGIEDAG